MRGRRSHGRPEGNFSGGSDLGGEQNLGPEHNEMTAASKFGSILTSLYGYWWLSRPGCNAGKADELWEETSESTITTAGVRVQAPGERLAEITSGEGPTGSRA